MLLCSECLLRVIAGYYPAKWVVGALTVKSRALCRCGSLAEFEAMEVSE